MNEGSHCLTTRSWDLSVSYRSQRFMFTMWMVGVDVQLEIDNSKRHLLSKVAMEEIALLLQVRLLNHHSGNSLRPPHTVGPTIHLHKNHRDRMFKRRRAIRGTRKKCYKSHKTRVRKPCVYRQSVFPYMHAPLHHTVNIAQKLITSEMPCYNFQEHS